MFVEFVVFEGPVFFGLNQFSKKKKEPMSKYYCTTVQSYNSSKEFLKAKLRPAQVLRPSLGQKRTPKAKQHTSMRANGRAT